MIKKLAIDSDSNLLVVDSRFSDGGRVIMLMFVFLGMLLNIPRLYRTNGLHNKSNSFILNLETGGEWFRDLGIQDYAVDPEDKTLGNMQTFINCQAQSQSPSKPHL